jgi:hypothetical protein
MMAIACSHLSTTGAIDVGLTYRHFSATRFAAITSSALPAATRQG